MTKYVEWHKARWPEAIADLDSALVALQEDKWRITDLADLTADEWREMKIKGGVKKALKNDVKLFWRESRQRSSSSDEQPRHTK